MQQVKAGESLPGVRDQRGHRGRVGDVGHDKGGLSPASANRLGCLSRLGTRDDRHLASHRPTTLVFSFSLAAVPIVSTIGGRLMCTIWGTDSGATAIHECDPRIIRL